MRYTSFGLLLRLHLKYHVFALLEKSMIVYVCSFSTITQQSALQRMARQGMLVTRDSIFISWFQSRIWLMRLQKMRGLFERSEFLIDKTQKKICPCARVHACPTNLGFSVEKLSWF